MLYFILKLEKLSFLIKKKPISSYLVSVKKLSFRLKKHYLISHNLRALNPF